MRYDKIIIIILALIINIVIVNATIIDKPLNISISNCFNISIESHLIAGIDNGLSFKDCSRIDANNFICNCLSSDNHNFSLVMQTDNYPVHEYRDYSFYITANYFNINKKTIEVSSEDYGDYYDVYNKSWNEKNPKNIIEKIVYINNTVYQNKTNYIPQIKEMIIEHNNTIYMNETQYKEFNNKIDKLRNNLNNFQVLTIISSLMFLICLALYINKKVIKK